MQLSDTPDWLRWARKIQTISQMGLFFSNNHHDERSFNRLQDLSAPGTTKRHLDGDRAHLPDPGRPEAFD